MNISPCVAYPLNLHITYMFTLLFLQSCAGIACYRNQESGLQFSGRYHHVAFYTPTPNPFKKKVKCWVSRIMLYYLTETSHIRDV